MKSQSDSQMAEVADLLHASRDWEQLTAYERTLRYCEEMVRRGQLLPAWNVIRDTIGRGSSNDINRAKRDFRKNHAEVLRKLDGHVEGLPDVLQPLISSFWAEAVAEAKKHYAEQVAAWEAKEEQAGLAIEAAKAKEAAAVQHAETLTATIAGLQESLAESKKASDSLSSQLAAEWSAREQAERLREAQAAEHREDRDKMHKALANAQKETTAAIERFENLEKHSLKKIDVARQEAAQRIKAVEAAAKASEVAAEKAILKLRDDLNKANSALQTLRSEIAAHERRDDEWKSKNAALERRAIRAEAQTDALLKRQSKKPKERMPGDRRKN